MIGNSLSMCYNERALKKIVSAGGFIYEKRNNRI